MTQEKDKNPGGYIDEQARDKCEFCLGAKGGVPGNENRIGGRIVCDYCSVLLASPAGTAAALTENQIEALLEEVLGSDYEDGETRETARLVARAIARECRHVHPIAPCGQVPSAASEETLRPVAGAAPMELETLVQALADLYGLIAKYAVVPDAEYHLVTSAAMLLTHEAAPLWCVNVQGPDDLYAMPSKAAALEHANALNIRVGELTHHEFDPLVRAVVIEWPHSAESHAADLRARQPSQCEGRGAPTAQSRTSEAGLAAPSYGALPDHPGTAANVTAQAADDARDAARDVLAERERQKSVEGWTPEHDDEHVNGNLALAAACYAAHTSTWTAITLGLDSNSGLFPKHIAATEFVDRMWPWGREWWKPKDRRTNLVRAGALILAEIERLDRAALRASQGESHE